jgi:hypothetical protein
MGLPYVTRSWIVDDAEFLHWYGPWASLSPPDVAELMAGLSVPWWIVGGWAIEAFTGAGREHEDVDIAFRVADLPAVLDHLLAGYCVWSNHGGTLRPLREPGELLEGCEQLWLRRDGVSPWLADLLLTPHEGEEWVSKRDHRIHRPLSDSLFVGADGIPYLRPEIVLHMKAKLAREKDNADFEAALPLLDEPARKWLREALELANPEIGWLRRLS